MLRAVLFDLDGVLTLDRTGSASTVRSLARYTGLPEESLRTAYCRHNREMLHGQLTHADIWPEMCAEVGREIDFALLHRAFVETPMDADMLSLARELKARGCLIALVTDNKADRIQAILAHNGLQALFDVVSVSAEIGSGKREQRIFEVTLAKLGVAPETCIFIDNSAHNLEIPRQMGIRTVLFDDGKRDVAALRAMLAGGAGT